MLIVDDDASFVRSLKRRLQDDFDVVIALNASEARQHIAEGFDILLLDMRLDEQDESNREGLELLSEFHSAYPDVPIVMMTAYGDIETAVEAMKCGAVDFLAKPFEIPKLRTTLHNALQQYQLKRRISALQDELHRIEPWEIIGKDPKIEEIRRLIQIVAQDGYVTVLITGETGTGKELVARAIHKQGWRSDAPFGPIALSALNPNLIERELFGHEKGAFTDATEARAGYIEQAHGGVLFLDEIGDLSPDMQVKLLRFLEERSFCRLGSTHPISVDVQVITATNQDLEAKVQQGVFRSDLYYRLKTFQIHLPPLRERREDIPLIIEHFLKLFRKQGRTHIRKVSSEAMGALQAYSWPGNVRELRSAIERAIIYATYHDSQQIEWEHLPLEIRHQEHGMERDVQIKLPPQGTQLAEELARLELSYIEQALRATNGRKSEAWKLLGLNDRFALLRRIKRIHARYPHLLETFPLIQQLYPTFRP